MKIGASVLIVKDVPNSSKNNQYEQRQNDIATETLYRALQFCEVTVVDKVSTEF